MNALQGMLAALVLGGSIAALATPAKACDKDKLAEELIAIAASTVGIRSASQLDGVVDMVELVCGAERLAARNAVLDAYERLCALDFPCRLKRS